MALSKILLYERTADSHRLYLSLSINDTEGRMPMHIHRSHVQTKKVVGEAIGERRDA